jgi:hypothetical protein
VGDSRGSQLNAEAEEFVPILAQRVCPTDLDEGHVLQQDVVDEVLKLCEMPIGEYCALLPAVGEDKLHEDEEDDEKVSSEQIAILAQAFKPLHLRLRCTVLLESWWGSLPLVVHSLPSDFFNAAQSFYCCFGQTHGQGAHTWLHPTSTT